MAAPSVSIVILNWNGLEVVKKTLPSVVATTYDNFQVVFTDNASTDESVEWVQASFPDVRIIKHPKNLGFCGGNNEAIRQTDSDFVLLLNNDVEVSPDWLTLLIDRITSDSKIAAVQPKLLQFVDRGLFEYAGGSGGYLDSLAYPFTRGRLFFTLERDTGQYDDARPVFWATGAAILLRRSALDDVGLLDESFFLHMEEIDLCWRLARAGYQVYVEPAAVVYHIGGSSLPQGHPQKTYYNFRNSLLMLYKNVPSRIWWRTFPMRFAVDAMAAGRLLLKGSWGEFAAIPRAYWSAHFMKKRYTSSRPDHASSYVPPPYCGSVALDYFFRRSKVFSALPLSRFRTPRDGGAKGETPR